MATAAPSRPSAREYLYGLALIAAICISVMLVSAFALSQVACGCTEPADLTVINASRDPVPVDWHTSGLLGTGLFRVGGDAKASGCQTTYLSLASGQVTAHVGAGAQARTVEFTVVDGSDRAGAFILISLDGSVSEVTTTSPGSSGTVCP